MAKTRKMHMKNTKNLNRKHNWNVYYLICPYKNIIRYIGISQNPERRIKEHLSSTERMKKENPYKYNWIEKIKRKNLKPKLEIAFSNLSFDQAFLLEETLIQAFKAMNPKDITNIAPSNKPPLSKGCKIYKCDSEGNILTEYSSIREAARKNEVSYGSINHCLAGRRNTCGGYIWRYAKK